MADEQTSYCAGCGKKIAPKKNVCASCEPRLKTCAHCGGGFFADEKQHGDPAKCSGCDPVPAS